MPVKVSLSDVTAVESLALWLDRRKGRQRHHSTLRSGFEFSEHERTCLSKVLAKEAVKAKPACDAYVDAITRWPCVTSHCTPTGIHRIRPLAFLLSVRARRHALHTTYPTNGSAMIEVWANMAPSTRDPPDSRSLVR